MGRPSQKIIAIQSRPDQTHSQEMAQARSISILYDYLNAKPNSGHKILIAGNLAFFALLQYPRLSYTLSRDLTLTKATYTLLSMIL